MDVNMVTEVKTFCQPSPAAQQRKLDEKKNLTEEEKLKAQITWLMKSLHSGYSNNSTDDMGNVLHHTDRNSEILACLNIKKTKASYVVNYELACPLLQRHDV